jgi:hypothetical protein
MAILALIMVERNGFITSQKRQEKATTLVFRGEMEIFIFLGFFCAINILVDFFGGVEDLFVSQDFLYQN